MAAQAQGVLKVQGPAALPPSRLRISKMETWTLPWGKGSGKEGGQQRRNSPGKEPDLEEDEGPSGSGIG